jgi:hypothetical protein
VEGGSPSCCAAARGSTIRTTSAPPSGTATTRTLTTPTLASVPAVSPPPSTLHRLSRWKGIQREHPRVTDPRVQTRSGDRRQPLARPAPSQRPHDPHSPGSLPHGPRDLGDSVGFCCPHTHHTSPSPWAARSSRARRRAALWSTSRQRAEGQQSDRAATAAPSGDHPQPAGARCRWREGKPWWYRGRAAALLPEGASTTDPDPVPRPPLHRGSASAAWPWRAQRRAGKAGQVLGRGTKELVGQQGSCSWSPILHGFAAAVGSVVQRLCL